MCIVTDHRVDINPSRGADGVVTSHYACLERVYLSTAVSGINNRVHAVHPCRVWLAFDRVYIPINELAGPAAAVNDSGRTRPHVRERIWRTAIRCVGLGSDMLSPP